MSTETDHSGQILAALERLSTRLDALESKVDALSSAAAPATAGEAAGLGSLVSRLDKIEASIDMIGHFAARVPVLSDAAGNMAGWAYEQAVEAGVDPIQAGISGARIALKAGQPENIALMERLLDQSGTVRIALDAAAKVDPADLRVVIEQGAALTGKLALLLNTPELAKLLDAGPKAVGVAETASTALVETRGHGVEPVGPFAAFIAMRDPDVKRAVGFGLAVAKRFGAKLA